MTRAIVGPGKDMNNLWHQVDEESLSAREVSKMIATSKP